MASGEKMKRDTLLGLVFFGGLGLMLWATLNLTDLSFGEGRTLDVYFPNGIGLQIGDPVLLLGTRVGKVEDVNVDLDAPSAPSHAVRVRMSLKEGAPLTQTASFEIQDSTVLGGKQVEIDPGMDSAKLDTSATAEPILGASTGSPLASIGETFSDPDNKTNLGGLLAAARAFFENLNGGEGTVSRLVVSPDVYDEILATVSSLKRSALAIEASQGSLGKFIHDPQMGDDIAQLATNLRDLTTKLNEGDGLFAMLANDGALASDVKTMIADAQALVAMVRAGDGPLGEIFTSEQLAADLKETVAAARRLMELAQDPRAGLVGKLLADGDLAASFDTIVANINEFSTSLASSNGLLSVLIEDEDMAEQFSRILRQVSRAIEDAREAAPIGTFVQAFTGGF